MGFVIAFAFVAWCFVALWWFTFAIGRDFGGVMTSLPLAVWVALTIGALVQVDLAATAAGPCLRWQTVSAFDPATKTVRPARHCAERGEWVE